MGEDSFRDRLDEAFETFPGQRRGLAKRIADRCHVSDQAVGRWRKTGKVQRENLAPLADELGVSVEWLLTGRGQMRRKEPEDMTVAIQGDTVSGVDPKRLGRKPKAGDQVVHVAGHYGEVFAVRVIKAPHLWPRYNEGETVVVSKNRVLIPGSDVYLQQRAGNKRQVSIYRLAWERAGEVALDPVTSTSGDGRIVIQQHEAEICAPVIAILPPAAIQQFQG